MRNRCFVTCFLFLLPAIDCCAMDKNDYEPNPTMTSVWIARLRYYANDVCFVRSSYELDKHIKDTHDACQRVIRDIPDFCCNDILQAAYAHYVVAAAARRFYLDYFEMLCQEESTGADRVSCKRKDAEKQNVVHEQLR